MSLPRLLPRFLARALGYAKATEARADLAAELEIAHADARASMPANTARAIRRLREPINFQPGLLDLYDDQAATTAYLYTLMAAAETNLDLADPDQRALYQALASAARNADAFREALAHAAACTLGDPDASTDTRLTAPADQHQQH